MIQQCPCELISWSTVNHLAHVLAVKIRKSRFHPDVVVAIARGGLVPARLVCDYLNLADLSSIRIVHYMAAVQKKKKAELVDGLSRDLSGKRVLLVDDVSDTGDTLELGRAHLAEQGAASLRTAVLHHKQTSTIVPDYFGHRIIKWRWITYPWAAIEDMTEFIERLQDCPADAGEVVWRLQQDYGLRVRRSLVEAVLALK
jgi:hypoxanthine phosphoribosyltransferase